MTTRYNGDLKRALEQALCVLGTQGREGTAASIRPIVFENLNRGGTNDRVCTYLGANPGKTPVDYVYHVADYYEELGSYLCQLQQEKSVHVWEPLFVEMQWWAYNFLRRKDFPPGQQTFQMAKDCAANAGGKLVQAYFPYDTDFDAWACTIVQNHCKKAIAHLLRAGHLPDHKLVPLFDLPPDLARSADLGGGQLTEWRLTLMQLIEQLTLEERETVMLYDFQGMTFLEIGQCLGISTTTAHRRYFSAIDFLRKNLIQNRI
jgi:RNA polymerase sigma factor (sigma-70 family)